MDAVRHVTHRHIIITASLLTFHYGTMDIGNHGAGACNTVLKLGNDGMGINRKFGLGMQSR